MIHHAANGVEIQMPSGQNPYRTTAAAALGYVADAVEIAAFTL
jgi:hypothetical protein